MACSLSLSPFHDQPWSRETGLSEDLMAGGGRHICHPLNSLQKVTFRVLVYCNEKGCCDSGPDFVSVEVEPFSLVLGLSLLPKQEVPVL